MVTLKLTDKQANTLLKLVFDDIEADEGNGELDADTQDLFRVLKGNSHYWEFHGKHYEPHFDSSME